MDLGRWVVILRDSLLSNGYRAAVHTDWMMEALGATSGIVPPAL